MSKITLNPATTKRKVYNLFERGDYSRSLVYTTLDAAEAQRVCNELNGTPSPRWPDVEIEETPLNTEVDVYIHGE